ncbi:MAG: succinate dehydrogenase/fumarate reductase iron-sulfur subunit [Deltaproteobacteria bacterium]|nr:MAG: succinate dehydrogenase/fumarate reductase iron-sulfur subunit [Deltaproteobacteria bacterium]
MSQKISVTLRVWRQASGSEPGKFVEYQAKDVPADASFLEVLDLVNDDLIRQGQEPIAFDYDCREGICGSCGLVINGVPHGPEPATTTCQLYMRNFHDGDVITVEPWRARAFPIVKDLVVDRSAFDRIMAAGGYVSVNAGSAPDANSLPVPKHDAEAAFEAAACIGCGACVAACKNASAVLFLGAKVEHLVRLPQGHPERERRVMRMVTQMDAEGFGACSNEGECEAVCPKEIRTNVIARVSREFLRATLKQG